MLFASLLFAVFLSLPCEAFAPSKVRVNSQTRVYEDFNFDFKNPKVYSDKAIFSEKQLREFTSQYSEDYRFNPLEKLIGLFKKDGSTKPKETTIKDTSVANSLKSTVSLAVLEEKTAQFVKGQIDAKKFLSVLNAAFGDKVSVVLPDILKNLPAGKASELNKVGAVRQR